MDSQWHYESTFNSDASETVAYNNPLFPAYIRFGRLSSYPDYSAISHWHRDLEFISVKKGCMTYNVNGRLILLKEGCGIFVNSRQLHYGFSAHGQECEFVCILLSPELLSGNNWFYEKYMEPVIKNSSQPYLLLEAGIPWQKGILDCLDALYRLCGEGIIPDDGYFAVLENFSAIMKCLYRHISLKKGPVGKESAELVSLRRMIHYVEEHSTEAITVDQIAAAGMCCRSKCSALFRAYLYDTPAAYTTKLRLRKSLTALLDSDESVTEIAYACGFGGTSYYCETFRRYYGMSPLQYRKKLRNVFREPMNDSAGADREKI